MYITSNNKEVVYDFGASSQSKTVN